MTSQAGHVGRGRGGGLPHRGLGASLCRGSVGGGFIVDLDTGLAMRLTPHRLASKVRLVGHVGQLESLSAKVPLVPTVLWLPAYGLRVKHCLDLVGE